MRKFNYEDNDDYRDEVDKFFSHNNGNEEEQELTNEEYQAIIEEEQAIQQAQIDFVSRELNHRVIRMAIRTCEKSFWWRFYSQNTKLRLIEQAYYRIRSFDEK